MAELYAYAVARIRALENSLFSMATIEQILACDSLEAVVSLLEEKGWKNEEDSLDIDRILSRQKEKIWETVKELKIDMSVFDVFTLQGLYHNLKAAIKESCIDGEYPHSFYKDAMISRDEMLSIVQNKEFYKLPDYMQEVAKEAYETLLHTGDGQKCDIMIDKATLQAIYKAGMASEHEIIRDYAKETMVISNIKIALRGQQTGKSVEFLRQALVECQGIDIEKLAKSAGYEAFLSYLTDAGYGEAVEAIKESPSAFERWCDDRMIETIQVQKYNPFTIGPVVAYVIARENEIKTVRIVATGIENGISKDMIRERIRKMYV